MRPFVILSFALLAACSGGGERPPPNPVVPSGGDAPGSIEELSEWIGRDRAPQAVLYRGDTIAIEVQDEPRYTIGSKVIPEDGEIRLVGFEGDAPSVKAAGRTPKELEEAVRERYSERLRSPYVTVSVLSFASRVVYVSGAVNEPGKFPVPNDASLTLLRALALAGDCAPNADRTSVRIFREDTQTGRSIASPLVSLDALIRHAADIPLQPNDIVQVPAVAEHSVSIFGKGVQNPGQYSWKKGMTVTKLISLAGGLTKFADIGDVRVLREIRSSTTRPRTWRSSRTTWCGSRTRSFEAVGRRLQAVGMVSGRPEGRRASNAVQTRAYGYNPAPIVQLRPGDPICALASASFAGSRSSASMRSSCSPSCSWWGWRASST